VGTLPAMRHSGARPSGAEGALLLALTAWGVFPLVLLVIHALGAHERLTGADGLIGADGVLGADQLQYLAWARDAGTHVLASNLFAIGPSAHVYLEPLFLITGLLARIGVPVQIAYLLWKPIAAVALFAAALGWAARAFGDELRPRAAAVALSLFLFTPLAALFSWVALTTGSFNFQLYLLGNELLVADKPWGYVPSALGLALAVLALLAAERAIGLNPAATVARRGRRATSRGALPTAFLAGAGASLLHPWLGPTLVVIFAGLALWGRGRSLLTLAFCALGAALPLAYYYLLSHTDAAWRLASQNEVIGHLSPLVLLAGLGPLAILALAGLRRPDGVVIEQMLLLWILGSFVTYFANDAFSPHALQGLSLPFAVLMVRGWQRLRLPAVLGALAIVLVTIPGLAYDGRKFVRVAGSDNVQYYLSRSESRALDWVEAHARPGGVLAPTPFADVVPSQTGRQVWIGHAYWTRDYPARAKLVNRLFGAHLPSASARSFVRSTGATLLISDCRHRASLSRSLGPLIGSVHRFGCARVYLLVGGRSRSR
jgi:hypothetical protein